VAAARLNRQRPLVRGAKVPIFDAIAADAARGTSVPVVVDVPAPASRAERKRRARERLLVLTRLMDAAIEVPLLRTRVGLDAALGLVPVAGDLVSAAIGVYLVAQARELGASRWLQARMLGNLLADAALGVVPVAGDLADVYFRAHLRNLKLLQKELGEPYIDATVTPRVR
jgi:hypothetical protein